MRTAGVGALSDFVLLKGPHRQNTSLFYSKDLVIYSAPSLVGQQTMLHLLRNYTIEAKVLVLPRNRVFLDVLDDVSRAGTEASVNMAAATAAANRETPRCRQPS